MRAALRIAFIYSLFSALWILLSDQALAWLVGGDADRVSRLQTFKGWLFVAVTAALLYALVSRALAYQHDLEQELRQRDDLFAIMFSDSPLGNALIDVEGELLQVNDRLCELVGYSREELLQSPVRNIIAPDDFEAVRRDRDILLEGFSPRNVSDRRLRHKDGHLFWAHVNVTPITHDGDFRFFMMTVEDITTRKAAETTLKTSEEYYRRYFNQVLIGMAVTNADRQWLNVNDRLCEILGYSRKEMREKTWAAMTHPEDLESNMMMFRRLVGGELDNYTLEKRFIRKDGDIVYTRLAVQALRTEDGQLDRILTSVEDVTQQRLAEAELRASEERFRRVVQDMPVMINALDEKYNIIFWNTECERVTGYAADEIVGNPDAWKIMYPDEAYRRDMIAAMHANQGDYHDWVWEITAKDGSAHAISWSNISRQAPVPDWSSWSMGIDITDQLTMETALRGSEERYRLLVEASPLPILVHRQGIIAFMNTAAIRTMGGSSDDVFVGKPIYDYVHPDDQTLVRDRMAKTYSGETDVLPVAHERFIRLDGKVIDVEVAGRVVEYMGETVSQVIFQDITERLQAEESLRRLNARLSALHEIDQAILSARSPEEVAQNAMQHIKTLVPCNRASLVTYDFDADKLRVLAVWSDTETAISSGFSAPLDQMPRSDLLWQGSPYIVEDLAELEHRTPLLENLYEDGVRSYVNVPLLVQGKLYGALNIGVNHVSVFDDETLDIAQEICNLLALALAQANLTAQIRRTATELEQRVAERTKALTAANARLQDLDRLKSKFVSDVSHELRAPITNLGMYLHLLERAKPEKRDGYMEVLNSQVERLKNLVENILDLSRLDLRKRKIEFAPVDLNLIVKQTVTAHLPQAEAAGLQLMADLDESMPMVWGERNQLAQVVANLLSNAINYTLKGRIVLTTRYETSKGEIIFSVQDTGFGIQPEDIPHLFDRFYRGEQPKNVDVPGTGLGLGIVKEIVDLHFGKITVDSVPAEGSTFTVLLPPASQTPETAVQEI